MQRVKDSLYRLLRWTERYTKTDMVYLAKGGSWLTIAQVVGALLALILAIGFANLLPAEVYGTYKFILALAGIAGAFSLTGMSSALTRLTAQEGPGGLWPAFKFHTMWNVIPVALTIFGSIYYLINENLELSTALLFALLAPLSASFGLAYPYFVGRKQFALSTKLDVVRNITATAVMLGAIFLSNNPLVIIGVYFVVHAILGGIVFLIAKKYDVGHVDVSKTNLREYSAHLSVMNVIRHISSHADSILLFHFLGPVALAVYSFAFAPTKEAHRLNIVIRNLVAPKLSTRPVEELRRTLPMRIVLFSAGIVAIVITYIYLAPTIYGLVFPQYMQSVVFSQWMILSLLVSPFIVFSESLVAHAKTRALYFHQTIVPAIRILLLVSLLPVYGIWGAVAAFLIPRLFSAILAVILFYTGKE